MRSVSYSVKLQRECLLGMLAAGDTPQTILSGYPWLELVDIQACLVYARRLVAHERIEPLLIEEIMRIPVMKDIGAG